jgi:hypothetical protein
VLSIEDTIVFVEYVSLLKILGERNRSNLQVHVSIRSETLEAFPAAPKGAGLGIISVWYK